MPAREQDIESGLVLPGRAGHIGWGRPAPSLSGKYSAHIGRWKEQKNRI